MPPLNELAERYALSIRQAAVRGPALIKKASVDQDFRSAVRAVIDEIDRLRWDLSGRPFTDAEKASLYQLIDNLLGVGPGSIGLVKRGSLASQLEYEQALMLLLQQVG